MEPCSLLHPGLSLNFDGALPLATAREEDEAVEEEKIKEKELQDLLTNAFDDLIEEDDDVDSERNADSEYYENVSRDGRDSRQIEHWTNDSDDARSQQGHHSPPQYLDIRSGLVVNSGVTPNRFQPLEPMTFASEELSERDPAAYSGEAGGGDHRWEEEQYYVDRLGDFDAVNLISGGELSGSQVERTSFEDGDDGQHYGQPLVQEWQSHASKSRLPAATELRRPETIPGMIDAHEETHQFLSAGENGDSNIQIKYQQLHVLYSARGREMQRLQQEFETYQRRLADETNHLRRQLSETRGNEQEHLEHLQEYQEKLTSSNNEIADMRGKLRAMEVQLAAISDNRKELTLKLHAAESTIEGLQAHIGELEQSESLVRAKEHHAAILSSMQGRHNDETYNLKSQLEQLKENLSERDHQLVDLKKNLDSVIRDCEAVKIEKVETVNRLLQTLEQSQHEYQKLVAGGPRPAAFAVAIESVKDDKVVEALRNELQATKQELDLFVSTSRLGIGGQSGDSPAPGSEPPVRQDSLISSLKNEVERSLLCLQRKNDQLKKVQSSYQLALDQLRKCQEQITSDATKLLNAEVKLLKSTEDVKQLMQSDHNRDVAAQEMLRRAHSDKIALEKQLQKGQADIIELSRNKQQLSELVRKLKAELEAVREAGERHAIAAVGECREACLQLHEVAVNTVREECRRQLEEMRQDHILQRDALTHNLDGVKNLYVKVCEEKDNLEDRLFKEFEEEKSREIENMKKMWMVVKEEEIKSVERKLLAKYKSRNKSTESDYDVKLEEHLSKAKKLWAKEQELVVEEQVLLRFTDVVRNFLSGKSEHSSLAFDDDLEQIEALEKRVKDSEDMFKKHMAEIEANLRKANTEEKDLLRAQLSEEKSAALKELKLQMERETDDRVKQVRQECACDKELVLRAMAEAMDRDRNSVVKVDSAGRSSSSDEHPECCRLVVVAETERNKAVAEIELRMELVCQERLQALVIAKDSERQSALDQMEEKLCSELEQFLVDQKQRYLSALQSIQDSHQREMSELRKNHETQMRQLNEDCQRFVEAAKQERDVRHGQQRMDAESEQAALSAAVDQLQERCRRLEAEETSIANAHQRQMRERDHQLEDARTRLEEAKAEILRLSVAPAPHTKEVATLQVELARLEELRRVERESSESAHRDLANRHRTLKDKVHKYHRYIHAKEREFSNALLRLNSEHSTALEHMAALKYEVPRMLEGKLEQLRREFLRNALERRHPNDCDYGKMDNCSGNGVQGPVKRMVDDSVVDELIEKFVQSLKKVHVDTLQYLDECSKLATDRIREEISLAACLVSSQHVVVTPGPSDDARSDPASKAGNVPSRLARQVSATANGGIEPTSAMSSGHGTMASSSNRSITDLKLATRAYTATTATTFTPCVASGGGKQLWAKDSVPSAQYWSSTPFQHETNGVPTAPIQQPPPNLSFNVDSIWTTPKDVGDLPSKLLGRLINQRLLMSLESGGVEPEGNLQSSERSLGSKNGQMREHNASIKPPSLAK